MLLRKFGQEVIRATAGKRIHGTAAVPGGINRHLTVADRELLAAEVEQMVAWSLGAVHMVRRLHEADAALYDHFGRFESGLLSLVREDGAMDLYDGHLRLRDADGRIVRDDVADQDYLSLITEEVRAWSYMKFPMSPRSGRRRVGTRWGRWRGCRTAISFPRRWPRPNARPSPTTPAGRSSMRRWPITGRA